jgi:hypothetical protein
VTSYVRRAWKPWRRCVVAAAAWRHGGAVLLGPQRRSTTAMEQGHDVCAGARRPRRTCVVAQRLRWHGMEEKPFVRRVRQLERPRCLRQGAACA